MSTNRWMHKENVIYTYNGILFGLKKEGNPVTCSNTDESWGHYATSEISQSQKHKYCMILLIWGIQSSQIHRDRK